MGQPFWMETGQRPSFPQAHDTAVHVAIVGGGITGVTAAYLLAKEGKRTAVLEAQHLGAGDSGHTTAHLTWLLDASAKDIERALGRQSGLLLDAHATAIDEIERIAETEQIECEFARIDAFVLGLEESDGPQLRREQQHFSRLGRACSFLGSAQAPFEARGGAIHVSRQAKFHPTKFLAGLARAASGAGAALFEHSKVIHSEYRSGEWIVKTADATIRAEHLVLATHSPIGILPAVHARMEPYRTYALAARIEKGLIPEASYFDTAEPYNYTRLEARDDHDIVIVGGGDHRTGRVPSNHAPHDYLARYLRSTFRLPHIEVVSRWAGQVYETVDEVAYVGEYPGLHPNRYAATGYSGNGMTYGVLSAKLLRDLIVGRYNALAAVLDPGRLNVRASGAELFKANVQVARDFVVARLSSGDLGALEQLAPGQGAILRLVGKKRAVYRRPDGELIVLSPKCPHMGCLVSWNAIAQSWDCSCHGSRFSPAGEVAAGPATNGLEPIKGEGQRG